MKDMGYFIQSGGGISLGILLMLTGLSCGNYPVLDVDTNMRIVLVPYDTPVGTIIYRLRASDSDNNFPLSFEVLGAIGKSILSLRFLGCEEAESLCQADVVLKKALDKSRSYEFQLQVKDTEGDYTKVHSAITATPGTANFNPTFMPRIIHLDESTPIGTELEKFVVAKNELNSRHVLLEIRDKADRIALKQRLVSNNHTEGTLLLKKALDYETEPWFTFQLLAMNAYTNTSCDTRNVLVSPVIVAIHDVQDSPPYFTSLPASVELQSSMKPGDLIATVAAVDGDKQNKRLIRYGFLTDSNPFVVFFDLDPMSGEIHLRRNLTELLAMAKPNEPIDMTVIAEEIIPDSGRLVGKSSSSRSSSSAQDNNSRAMGKITFWFGKGSSFGPAAFSSDKYVGEVKENSVSGTLVQFGVTEPRVSHQHPTEIIALTLQPGAAPNNIDSPHHISQSKNNPHDQDVGGFQVLPSQGSGNFSFQIRVTDSKLLDHETTKEFTLYVVAVTSSGMSSEAQVTVHVRDENDESPVFTQSEYHVELPEHPAKGTRVLQVQAIDKDTTGSYGKVTYSNLVGSNAFRLDPITGDITVERPELIDRELDPEIRLYVEAKDGGYSEVPEPNSVRNLGTAMIIIKLTDKNDHAPEFLQKYYQAVLNPILTELKDPLFVKAFDPDEGVNAQIRYQIKDTHTRFYVDPISGEFRLRGAFQRDPKYGDNPFLGTVKVYAYDLGNPKMTSETIVQLFAEEMVTREIQFVFPAPPDRIRRNKTNFEIMLSKLSGGVVAIQNVAPYRNSRAGSQVQGAENDPETTSTDPGDEGIPARFRQTQENPESNTALTRRAGELASASDKSLVTATVQYPVSASPTTVDLSQIPNVYGGGNPDTGQGGQGGQGTGGSDGNSQGQEPQDTDRIRLYEAENRALFWILISFLLILLILFAVFLCCVYCPWCWLYGHCYSKGDKMSREHSGRSLLIEKRRRSDSRSRHKTYPEKIEDEEAEYDKDGFPRPPAPPARGHRHARREAWSGEERKTAWRTSHQSPRSIRRYRGTPPPRSRKVGPQPHETDVALEDWEFDAAPPRPRDQAEEIGSRWQLHQQPMSLQPQPQQMMPVPVPIPMQPPRRVAFGHQGPNEDAFVRRSQEVYMQDDGQLQRGSYGVRPVPVVAQSSLPAGVDERAVSHLQQRKTRFFRTETGEVLQFGDYEGDEGKELLIKRYIDEQQPKEIDQYQQQSFGSQHQQRPATPGMVLSQPRLDELSRGPPVGFIADSSSYLPDQRRQQEQQQQQGAPVDRPKAAIMNKRQQKSVSLSKDVTFDDDDDDEERVVPKEETRKKREELPTSQPAISRSDTKKSRSRKSDSESDGETRREREREDDQRRRRTKELERKRRKSPTPPSEDDSRRSRSPTRRNGKKVSKSTSRSKTRSVSPPQYKSKSKSPSRSKSRTRSRSISPTEEREKRRKAKQQTQDRETKQHKLKRHHYVQQPSKASRDSRDKDEHEKDREQQYHRTTHGHHHHHRLKHKDSKQQHSKDSRGELSREKSKSMEPSLTSLPISIDETEREEQPQPTTSEDVKASEAVIDSATDVREESPPFTEPERRRRSSVFRQESEDATQIQSMVDINVIPPSSARTDSSSNNPKDVDIMSDAAPPTPDARESAQLPETAISSTVELPERDEDVQGGDAGDVEEEEETGAVVIEADTTTTASHPQTEPSAVKDGGDDDHVDGKVIERADTIPEPEERLPNDEIIASQSTLDIAEAEAAAAAVAPSDSVDIPQPGDVEPEPSDRRGPDEDDDSGIGMVGYLTRRNKMLEKKSVFTIAYDEVAQSTMMRPDTRGSTGETENEMSTSVK
ncbi:unnamed protein product [Orchesella dallaii]|uniref:Cadherin domain-containing protein n=1 Tax=Orchesella dallaii TaxID=48710 RepID=A0ABP1QKQ5_9HEXA